MVDKKGNILNKVYQALSQEPHLFIIEKDDDETKRVVENALKDEGLWGLIRKEETKNIIIYYIDKSKLIKLCSYESCSNIENSVEFEVCIQKCVDSKIENIIKKKVG